MKQFFKISGLILLLCTFFFATDSFAQRGKKKKKPRNFGLEKKLIGNWNAQSQQAFYPQITLSAGNRATLGSMAGNLNGTYVVRGRKLIIKGKLEGAPANAKKRTFRYNVVSIQGRTLTLKRKNKISRYTK
ncbi:hypothetical protein BKI52_11230 [marine bacterium AO1-C]|nr:hypothetical protein BKI52_11230 [marine bacterium AO1-C]